MLSIFIKRFYYLLLIHSRWGGLFDIRERLSSNHKCYVYLITMPHWARIAVRSDSDSTKSARCSLRLSYASTFQWWCNCLHLIASHCVPPSATTALFAILINAQCLFGSTKTRTTSTNNFGKEHAQTILRFRVAIIGHSANRKKIDAIPVCFSMIHYASRGLAFHSGNEVHDVTRNRINHIDG